MNPPADEAFPGAIYAFGEFRLDVRRVLLSRDGADVTLTPKAFAVLELLVRHAGRVVQKHELLAAAWPKVVVEEANLSQTIYLLRRALGEHRTDHRYIVTVPGRGYRFVADVRLVEDERAPSATDGAAPATGVRSTAPAGPEVETLVIAPPAAETVESPTAAAPSVSMARTVRGTPWTSRAALALLVLPWLLLFGATRPDVEPVASRPPDAAPAMPRPATADAALVRARFLFSRRAPGDLELARLAFEDLLARDPLDADAWAGLAGALAVQALTGERDRDDGLRGARFAAERAIELSPRHAEAHMRLAMTRRAAGDEAGAREACERARRLDPDAPLVLGARAEEAASRGDYAEAVRLARRGLEREPLNVASRVNLTVFLLAAHRFDEAEAEARRAFEIYPGDDPALTIGQIMIARGDVDGARRTFASLRDRAAREQASALVEVASQRRGAAARPALERLAANVGSTDPFVVAEAYAVHGDTDRAFEWLERAAPSDGRRGIAPPSRPRWTMPASPLLAQLHADPRWFDWERGSVARE